MERTNRGATTNVPLLFVWRASRRPRFLGALGAPAVLGLATLLIGCGTDWQQVLIQESSAVGVTLVDRLLTNAANSLLDRLDEVGQSGPADDGSTDADGDADGDGNGDADGDGDDGGGGTGGDLGSLTGIAASGESLYAQNSCTACHCAGATGGCLSGAPRLIRASADSIDAALRGDAPHPAKPSLTDQDVVDLAAYLASLAEP